MLTLVLCVVVSPSTSGVPDPNKTSVKKVVSHAKTLSKEALTKFLEKLAEMKDFDSLAAICQSDLPNRGLAVRVYARCISSDKVIAFCANFPLESYEWRAAFWELQRHPKKKVIGYIKQIATSSNPEVRYLCYELCDQQEWGELEEYAKKDSRNKSWIFLNNVTETLGERASRYLDHCKERRTGNP